MTLSPVESSNIRAIGYDGARRHLYIEFKAAGLYRYDDVPPQTVAAFMGATSIGQHFHRHIKGAYKHTRIEEAATADAQ